MMKTLNILGYQYEVRFAPSQDMGGKAGRFMTLPPRILVAEDCARDQQISTMLHEIIEGLDYHLELKLEHNQISALEAGLFQVLTTNGVDLSPPLGGNAV